MTVRKELLEIPDVLQQMLEEGRPRYDALIRRVNWGERPVFMLGGGPSFAAALTGAWVFESLLGIPVVVQRPEAFTAYTSRALAIRSLVVVVAASDDCEATMAAAQKARSRGATVWAITPNPAGELAALADAALDSYAGGSSPDGVRPVFCRHALMLFLAMAAAAVLKVPPAVLSAHQEDLEKLPRHVEWVLNQIPDAAQALATEIKPLPQLFVTGGGAFHPIALHAADRLRQTAAIAANGSELLAFEQSSPRLSPPGSAVLYLSSSRCRLKAQVHQSARRVRQADNRKIFALTDGNDRQLSERADLAVLLPILTEAGGALVSLTFLELVAGFAARPASSGPARKRRSEGRTKFTSPA